MKNHDPKRTEKEQELHNSAEGLNSTDSAPLQSRRSERIQWLITGRFSLILRYFEVCLAVVSVMFVVLGAIHLLRGIPQSYALIGSDGIQKTLEALLSDILLLVVGIELAILLVSRTPEGLVEVMFFVIARKMLLKTEAFYDLLIGIVALACLFAIRKYLVGRKSPSETETI